MPHGCAGSATIKIRVQIPDGVIAVKPMPKAGWNVEAIRGKYDTDYDFHGTKLTEGVKEVVWSGGKLPDAFYDEFVVSTFLTDGLKPNTTLYFPVVQECEQGVSRWIDIPADAARAHDEQIAGAGRQTAAEAIDRFDDAPSRRPGDLAAVLCFATGASAHASLVSTEPGRRQRFGGSAKDGAIALQ